MIATESHCEPIDRWPARLEILQAATGVALVLFIWAHSFFVASALVSDQAMYQVARMFEGEPLFGKPYPVLVSLVALVIFLLVFVHGVLAMRKFPASYRQYRALRTHLKGFRHADSSLWMVQVVTGVLLMFLVCIHLFQMASQPGNIGPYASADRIWSDNYWLLYLVLLLCAEIHGGVGLYRVILKWGWLDAASEPGQATPQRNGRKRLKLVISLLVSFFILLGLATLAHEMRKGMDHADRAGERYVPAEIQGGH